MFYGALKKHRSKTFLDLYKAKVSITQNVEKTIKADKIDATWISAISKQYH